MGTFEITALAVVVGIGIAAVKEYRWTVVKERELDAQLKKIRTDRGNYGRLVRDMGRDD